MKRRLVAALAVRNEGTRLYGKPLQNLIGKTSILDQIIAALKKFRQIDQIVLGISEGTANQIYVDIAKQHNISCIFGHPEDVLSRLIQCGQSAGATDVMRVTSECPWFDYDRFPQAWEQHIREGNDLTTNDYIPQGLVFEIFRQEAMEQSHKRGSSADRSELCSNYFHKHPEEFRIGFVFPPKELQRVDLRVTVDYPEDLILCRGIAKQFESSMPHVSLKQIVTFLDEHPELKNLVAPFVIPKPRWEGLSSRQLVAAERE